MTLVPFKQNAQELLWAGGFGLDYTERNFSPRLLGSNVSLFSHIYPWIKDIQSIIEFGPNVGMNILALRQLIPCVQSTAVEINEIACKALSMIPNTVVHQQSLLGFSSPLEHDLSISKGVLIHIDPGNLPLAYNALYENSSRFIYLAEYYNPTPVSFSYRGKDNALFKRDFAGEMLDRYPDLRLRHYGFTYHRDPFPQDDLTWFLLEKS
jgi:pseudaminic acid biosynthesis-associated methylase